MTESEANAPTVKLHFTDEFGVDPTVLRSHGAYNVSLISDLPLFIDPFLLFTSSEEGLQGSS